MFFNGSQTSTTRCGGKFLLKTTSLSQSHACTLQEYRADVNTPCVHEQVDLIVSEHVFSVVADLLVVCIEYMILTLHHCDLEVSLNLGVYLAHVFLQEVVKLGRELHPTRAAAHHHEMEQSLSLVLRLARDVGGLHEVHDRISDRVGVSDVLQEKAVFLHPGGVESVIGGPHSHDQNVIVESEFGHLADDGRLVSANDFLILWQKVDAFCLEELHFRVAVVPQHELSERFHDAAPVNCPNGDAWKERREHEIVTRGHHGEFELAGLQVTNDAQGAPTRSQENHLLLLGAFELLFADVLGVLRRVVAPNAHRRHYGCPLENSP